ncbi:MAG TPA: hypothetical protein VMZ28_03180 [Kofleriaceae bacterium]|nr:hypothetical protein [Kofleriaceae bacterium]
MTRALLAAVALLAACESPPGRASFVIETTPDLQGLLRELVASVPLDIRVADPGDAGAGIHVVVAADLDCGECYRIDQRGDAGDAFLVRGGGVLGVQYGVAHLLELHGVRFLHPWETYAPETPSLQPDAEAALGVVHQAEVAIRGLHLHTLHPIEAYRGLWEPAADGALDEAAHVFNWLIANRGNHVQWVALDDILEPARGDAWRAYAAELVDLAHRRGLRTGIGLQLFGSSNLQRGFDLIDADEIDEAALDEMRARWELITAPGFDVYNLSFGEFFAADPALFVSTVNQAFAMMRDAAPDAAMSATIHVGASDDQRVTYQGEEMPYYFLVRFADPRIEPLVHTVMYYNLFEDAGGAYHHDEFDEHRAFLLERLAAGEPVGYFPETAYWVAFDDSVPIYAPLYVRSRWLDLARIAAAGPPLEEQILFSSGWEWGYWQNDRAALRAAFQLPPSWRDLFREMYAPRQGGAALSAVAADLAEVEHDALIEQRLAGYLAGRDLYIDVGGDIGIVSQPDRVTFADLAAADAGARADFEAGVLADLDGLEAALAALDARAGALGGPDDRFRREVIDGVRVTWLRARFIAGAYRAALAHLDGRDGEAMTLRAAAADELEAARAVVERRHGDLHFPDPARLLDIDMNQTVYPFGYLTMAHRLCYWERELAEVGNLLDGTGETVPSCIN